MTNQDMLEEISHALALLALQTAAENQAGLFSKNRLVEDLMLPLFRVVFGAPDLRNANEGLNNFPYVDLIGEKSRCAIQVTTERSAAKVTATLSGFLDAQMYEHYDRLIVFVLSMAPLKFQKATRDAWSKICLGKLDFDASRDILSPIALFPMIQSLPQDALEAVYRVIAKSVIGKQFVDVEAQLENISRRALEYEKSTGKYIPDVFIETSETKQLARIFCHPALFFKRQMESFPTKGIVYWNEFLAKVGLEPLPVPDRSLLVGDDTLAGTIKNALIIPTIFADIIKVAKFYGEGGRSTIPSEQILPNSRAFYEQNAWSLTNDLGFGFKYRLEEFAEGAAAAGKQICLLTGSAGQGKTNFVCDLVDTFILRHGIPAAYVSVRRLALQQGASLGNRLTSLLFDQKVTSFQECASLLSEAAVRTGKPFVLILDGLNEHPNGPHFAIELEAFLHEFLAFPMLRILMTCRSEFFEQRFSNLKNSAFAEKLIEHRIFGRNFDAEEQDDLISAYFNFFHVQSHLVSQDVVKRLEDDVLLLRFFCEAYGARGKEDVYKQPRVTGIYRDEIFEIYLNRKLSAIDEAAAMEGSPASAQRGRTKAVKAVLTRCMAFMLEKWQFGNIPVKVIPEELTPALEALLQEELIIRRDAPASSGFFSPSDETLNFTFDEFRDFLLAQYLVLDVFASDRAAFEGFVTRTTPSDSPTAEGLKRFLFYIGRKHGDAGFKSFYLQHPWYSDVYQEEVFNLPSALLDADDEKEISKLLLRCDYRAKRTAVELALNWDAEGFPRLNLGLLLDVVAQGDEKLYQCLIQEPFSTKRYESNGVSVEAFATFVETHVLPSFDFKVSSSEHVLFRFLTFLLPVDTTYNLDSPASRILRKAADINADYISGVLLDSLNLPITSHIPYVWRLLTQIEKIRPSDDSLQIALATNREGMPPGAVTELDRFIGVASKTKEGNIL